MARDFMTDPAQLQGLEGQQYLVLRPAGAVMHEFDRMQDAARQRLGDTVRYPAAAHVTLRGFFEPQRVDDVREVVRSWAARQRPVEVVFEAVDVFPAPWQIVIARLARTPSLLRAYATMTAAVTGTTLRRLDELPIDHWIFHLSAVYAKDLDPQAWARLAAETRRDLDEPVVETIAEAEFVTYSEGAEQREVLPLGG